MMKKEHIQYTIRSVPERLDDRLRESAVQYGTSLNKAALNAMSKGLGMEEGRVICHDLDDLAGTWVQDDEFDKAMTEMDQVDPEMWK